MRRSKCINIALVILIVVTTSFRQDVYKSGPKTLADSTILLPIGGNTWPTNNHSRSTLITNKGIVNWTDEHTGFHTYLRLANTGTIKIKLKARTDGSSQIKLELKGLSKTIIIHSRDYIWYDAGEWNISDTGYIKLHVSAISKTSVQVCEISDYGISGSAITGSTAYVKNMKGIFSIGAGVDLLFI